MKTLRIVLLSSFVALLATFVLAFGASAHTGTAHAFATPNAGAPIVKIVQNGNSYAFSPTKIHLFFQHSQFVEFDNTTNVVQVMLNRNGNVFAKIIPGGSTTHHFLKKGTFVYHLMSNPSATVTIVLS